MGMGRRCGEIELSGAWCTVNRILLKDFFTHQPWYLKSRRPPVYPPCADDTVHRAQHASASLHICSLRLDAAVDELEYCHALLVSRAKLLLSRKPCGLERRADIGMLRGHVMNGPSVLAQRV